MTGSPPIWLFPTFSFVGFVLMLIPLPWHLEAWNSGTCLYLMWTALGCLNYFINALIWKDNALDVAPSWCDFSTTLTVGLAVAIPAASLCINRRLYSISKADFVILTVTDKRRMILIDLAIGLGIPGLEMILHIIPQGHRYDIYEGLGCMPDTYLTIVGYLLVTIWPILVGLVSAVYCCLSIRAFYKQRKHFQELLSVHSNLNTDRYLRLMCLAGTELLLTIPLATYALYLAISISGIQPWISWADTHADFFIVDKIPAILWRANPPLEVSIELTRWFLPFSAFVFFAYFGFAEEAKKYYRRFLESTAHWIRVSRLNSDETSESAYSADIGLSARVRAPPPNPRAVYIKKEIFEDKRDSIGSFTDASHCEPLKGAPASYDDVEFRDVGGLLNNDDVSSLSEYSMPDKEFEECSRDDSSDVDVCLSTFPSRPERTRFASVPHDIISLEDASGLLTSYPRQSPISQIPPSLASTPRRRPSVPFDAVSSLSSYSPTLRGGDGESLVPLGSIPEIMVIGNSRYPGDMV